MDTPTGMYQSHFDNASVDAENGAGMTSKRLHRFVFDRNKKANPHLMQSADYHIYNMVSHQDPYAAPGGPDAQAMIIEEACGLHRRVRCPEIQVACHEPYMQDDQSSYVSESRGSYVSRGKSPGGSRGYAGTPYPESERSFVSKEPSRRGGSVRSGYSGSARSGYSGSRVEPPVYRPSSAAGSEGRRSARSADRSRGQGGGGGGSAYSGSYYTASEVGRGGPRNGPPQAPQRRPRSSDGGRGSMRSSQRSSVVSGSEYRSDYGSQRSAPGSVDGRSRGSGGGGSRPSARGGGGGYGDRQEKRR